MGKAAVPTSRPWLALAMLLPILTAACASAEIRPVLKENGTDLAATASAFEAGKKAFAAGQFARAATLFRRAVDAHPKDPAALDALAAAYDQLGRFELADPLYEKALIMRPQDAAFLNNFGYSLLMRGRVGEAGMLLREAAHLAPEDKVIAANLALAQRPGQAPAAAPLPLIQPPAVIPFPHLERVGRRAYRWVSGEHPRPAWFEVPVPTATGDEPPPPAAAPPVWPVGREALGQPGDGDHQGNNRAPGRSPAHGRQQGRNRA